MRRKIIKQGHSTHTITLPASWVKKYGLKGGDEINVEKNNGSLIISTEKGYATKSIKLDISNLDPMIRRIIAAAYKSGYDDINVIFNSSNELKQIQKIMSDSCIGLAIVNEGKRNVAIRKITHVMYEEFDTLFRRTFLFLIAMGNDLLDASKIQDIDNIKSITLRDVNINKFTDFCRRILNKKGYTPVNKTSTIYYITEELEKIGDLYNNIAKHLSKNPTKLSNEVIKHFEDTNNYLKSFYDLFYKFELKKLVEFGKKKTDLHCRSEELFKKLKREELKVLFHLCTIVEVVYNMLGALIISKL